MTTRRGFLGALVAALVATRLGRWAQARGYLPPPALVFQCQYKPGGGEWRHVLVRLTKAELDAIAPAVPQPDGTYKRELRIEDLLARDQGPPDQYMLDDLALSAEMNWGWEPGTQLSLVVGPPSTPFYERVAKLA